MKQFKPPMANMMEQFIKLHHKNNQHIWTDQNMELVDKFASLVVTDSNFSVASICRSFKENPDMFKKSFPGKTFSSFSRMLIKRVHVLRINNP